MVLCFQIFYYMFSLEGLYNFFVVNCWKWLASFVSRIIGYDDLESLDFYEKNLLKGISNPVKTDRILIGQGLLDIWTILVESKQCSASPIIFLHSLGYGAGFWSLNINELSKHRSVYAVDMLGFGRSSRTSFSTGLASIENEFVESLEAWRIKMGLENFILLGHGFGGYVAFLYGSRFPNKVKHVVLVEPWGFDVDPKHYKRFISFRPPSFPVTITTKFAAFLITYLNHFSLLRFVGPGWGVDLIKKLRGDLLSKFSKESSKNDVAKYLYYWNAAYPPSGEKAFRKLSLFSGYARHPLMFRINSIPKNVPMTFVTGSRSSYVGHDIGNKVKHLRKGSYVDIQVINGAGHYVFIEKNELFNRLIEFICHQSDKRLENLESFNITSRRKRSNTVPSSFCPKSMTSETDEDSPVEGIDQRVRRRQHKTSFCMPRNIAEEVFI